MAIVRVDHLIQSRRELTMKHSRQISSESSLSLARGDVLLRLTLASLVQQESILRDAYETE